MLIISSFRRVQIRNNLEFSSLYMPIVKLNAIVGVVELDLKSSG
jgi:hypothetical protein